jgi:hypothetical protein
MAKVAFNEKSLFTSKLDVNISEKRVKCYVRSVAFSDGETWTLRKSDQKYLESFEWRRRRLEEISWAERVRSEEVL